MVAVVVVMGETVRGTLPSQSSPFSDALGRGGTEKGME